MPWHDPDQHISTVKVQRPVLERDDEAKPDVHADHVRCTPQQAAEGAASILMRHEQPPVI